MATVLAVDDDPKIRKFVTATLEGTDNRRVDLVYVPATPLKVWETIQRARKDGGAAART